MTTLFLILAFISVFVLGSGLTFLAVASYIVTASDDGELGIASWDKKEKRWKVFGSYMAISGKLSNLLKHDPDKVHYVDTSTKKSKYKVKVGVKR